VKAFWLADLGKLILSAQTQPALRIITFAPSNLLIATINPISIIPLGMTLFRDVNVKYPLNRSYHYAATLSVK